MSASQSRRAAGPCRRCGRRTLQTRSCVLCAECLRDLADPPRTRVGGGLSG